MSNSSPVENQQRSAMIMSMEKTLNNAWFMRRTAAKDQYCTLSSSQYWDFLTYIDVRSLPKALLLCFALFVFFDRMFILLNPCLSFVILGWLSFRVGSRTDEGALHELALRARHPIYLAHWLRLVPDLPSDGTYLARSGSKLHPSSARCTHFRNLLRSSRCQLVET